MMGLWDWVDINRVVLALVGREFDPEGKGPTGFYPPRIEHEFFFFFPSCDLHPFSLRPFDTARIPPAELSRDKNSRDGQPSSDTP